MVIAFYMLYSTSKVKVITCGKYQKQTNALFPMKMGYHKLYYNNFVSESENNVITCVFLRKRYIALATHYSYTTVLFNYCIYLIVSLKQMHQKVCNVEYVFI